MQQKCIIAIILSILSTMAYSSNESMSPLSYRVKLKELNYCLGLELGKEKYTLSSVDASLVGAAAIANTDHTSYEGSRTKWANNFTYGLTDSFSLSVGINLDLINTLTTTADSTGTNIHSASTTLKTASTFNALEMKNGGFEDIQLNSSYRYLNNNLKADLLIGIALSGKTKKAELNYNSSNNYVVSKGEAMSGGSSIQIGTAIFGYLNSYEWATKAGINYKLKKIGTVVGGDLNSSNTNLDYDKEIKSKMDLNLNFVGQVNLNPILSIGSSLRIDFVSEEDANMSIYGGGATLKPISTIDSAHTDITLSLHGKYQLMNNIILALNYSHLFGGDIDGSVSMPTINTNDITHITDRKDDRFGFNLDFRI